MTSKMSHAKTILGFCFAIALFACSPTRQPIENAAPHVDLPSGWTSIKRTVRAAAPEGKISKEITYYRNSIGMEFVLIPAGEFTMGSPVGEKGRCDDEGPQHQVRITRPFYMGAFEITLSQLGEVMGEDCDWDKEDLPVEGRISWDTMIKFCELLSQREGLEYKLPTEAEWEYACRAGTATPFYVGNTISPDEANYDHRYRYGEYGKEERNNVRDRGFEVKRGGNHPPNAFGLYDMHGNAWEWCADWFGEHYYLESPTEDPTGPVSPPNEGHERRVVRGGSWDEHPNWCRSAARRCGRAGPSGYIWEELEGGRVAISVDDNQLPKHAWKYSDLAANYSGMWTKRYRGQKGYEGNYKNGRKHGTCTEWYRNRQKKWEANYKEGKLHGTYTEWYWNGEEAKEANYNDGQKHGTWRTWYGQGQKFAEGNFTNGKEDGPWKIWYSNGQKVVEFDFENGKHRGTLTYWYRNGQKHREYNDGYGRADGTHTKTWWRESGQKLFEENYKDGKRHGMWTEWDEKGKVSKIKYYENGKLMQPQKKAGKN